MSYAPAADAPVAARGEGIGAWLMATDHKKIGWLYVGTAFLFFFVAIAFAILMRTQTIQPGLEILSPQQYNQVFSMHGTTMVFLFAMPGLIGFANYFVPLMIGARDMAFPRLNALSYWTFLFGGILLYSSFMFGGALETGWFSYATLNLEPYSTFGVTIWTMSLVLLGMSSMLGAINFIVTMMKLRAPGMSFYQMPLFAFATYVNSFLILFAIPSLTAAVAMLYLDRELGAVWFDPQNGGSAMIWQHLFWFFGHPEVYILIVPAFGMVSEIVPVFSRKPLFGRGTMMIALGLIGLYGFWVWAHHMFATGLSGTFFAVMSGTSMLIAIPTGIKIFNWLATMWGGSLRFNTPLLFCCGMIALFTVGGITGVTLAVVPFDWQVTDTYYVVAHFHNVLFAGTLFAVFGAVYYWFPKMTGRLLDDRLGKVHFTLIMVGFLVTFMPMYALGILGMPRRVYTYAPDVGWNSLNLVASIGGYIIAISLIVFVVNAVWSLRKGRIAGDNPWNAWTLEWATTSPPPPENFVSLPPIRSERPLWDLQHPERPEYVIPEDVSLEGHPPGPEAATAHAPLAGPSPLSPLPILAATAMLVIAIALLVHSILIGIVGLIYVVGLLVAWALVRWPEPEMAMLPGERFSATGAGMLVFLGSETVLFGSLIYAYLHVRLHALTWPPNGIERPELLLPVVITVILVASGIPMHYAQVAHRKGRMRLFRVLLLATIVLGAVFLAGEMWEWAHLGFGLDSLMGTVLFTLTGFHAAHVTGGLILLMFIYGRSYQPFKPRSVLTEAGHGPGGETRLSSGDQHADAGQVTAHADISMQGMVDASTYYWHFVDAVWVIIFILIYLL